MRTQVKKNSPEVALLRVLDAMTQELVEASDEEIQAVAAELRMDLNMRESAAYAGVTYFAWPRLSEFFDLPAHDKLSPPKKD